MISNINGVIHNYAAFELIQEDLNILKNNQNRSKNINNFYNFENFILKNQKPFKIELTNISFSYKNKNNLNKIF